MMENTQPAVQVQNICKLYRNNRGVRGVSFEIETGGIYGLLGPNGSGKTTAMKIITGLTHMSNIRPSHPAVMRDGEVHPQSDVRLFGVSAIQQREIAMDGVGSLIESPALFPHLSLYKNLEIICGYTKHVPKNVIYDALDTFGIAKYATEKTGGFSLGMKQRAGLATAFIMGQRLIILDEPANGLDIQGIAHIRNLIKSRAADGVTFLISSHLAHEIEITCTHVGVMHDGLLLHSIQMQHAVQGGSLEQFYLNTVEKHQLANQTNKAN